MTTITQVPSVQKTISPVDGRVYVERLLATPGTTDARISLAYQLAFARLPTEDELRDGANYLTATEQRFASARVPTEKHRAAWSSYCRVIYSANEFIYLD